MARYDWFILRIWRSGHRDGEQWAGKLERMSGGESLRFSDPDLLLDHLRALIAPATVLPECPSQDEERADRGGGIVP
jgi:hypothetical protein